VANTGTRQAKRAPVTLKIKFKSATLDQFIERYSVDVSHGGIFIRTKDPLAVGTTLKFEFQLKDASPLIRGEGTVVWTREHDPSRTGVAPGMGVRFDRLPSESQQVLDKILTHKSAQGERKRAASNTGQFTDTPTRVAPSPLVAGLMSAAAKDAPENALGLKPDAGGFEGERTDATPLPSPMPFHSDVDEFPDEAFEEKTRVSALDPNLLRRAAGTDDEQADDDLFSTPKSDSKPAKVEPSLDELAEKRAAKEKADKAAADKAAADKAAADKAAADKAEAAAEEKRAAQAKADKAKASREKAAKASQDKAPKEKAGKEKAAKADKDKQKAKAGKAKPAAAKADKAKPEPDKKKAAAAAPTDDAPPEKRSSGSIMALLAAAVVVLGVGGYVVFGMGGKDKKPTAANGPAAHATAPDEVTPPTPAPTPDEPVADDTAGEPAVTDDKPPEPAIETTEYAFSTKPAGAIATLVDGDQSGPTPMTFTGLDKAKSYQVRVTLAGHEEQVVTIDPTKAPKRISLKAMLRVLKVSSTPVGARVYVNGRKQAGVTPMEVPLEGSLARAKSLRVSVRKSGFLNGSSVVAKGAEFTPADNTMVHEVALLLQPRPKVAAKRIKKVDEPKKVEPKVDEPKKDEPKKVEPKKDEPVDEGPTPDWMK
jgi:uncharacterized protein (TIGR02266 family)